MTQRLLDLRIKRVDGDDMTLRSPEDPNVAPPGYYMLFILNEKGVPSIARMVRLGAAIP
jgi:hypothetical protein